MPVIELHSPDPSPGPEALGRISAAVTALLGLPDGQCWLLWHRTEPSGAYRPQWSAQGARPAPVGFVTCKQEYTTEQVTELLRLLRKQLGQTLEVAEDDVYLAVRRAAPGELLVRGEVWGGRPAADPAPVTSLPVAHVVGGREAVADDDWGSETAVLRLDGERFGPEALFGLESFSHLEVLFHFDRVQPHKIQSGARHPRGNTDWPLVGIFAQRGKNRPNRLGVSRCRLLKVDGLDVHVQGLDAVDGTPVLDIKPYMREFGPQGGETTQPDWATEIMRSYY
jgi:tRNA-Thr(GGU) m(6)t(6)A37 methyltransferase TsaA